MVSFRSRVEFPFQLTEFLRVGGSKIARFGIVVRQIVELP